MFEIYRQILELYEQNVPAAVCTIISSKGSTPLKPGAKMIVTRDRVTYGTVGGGRLENQTIEKAVELINAGKPERVIINLTPKTGSTCGGVAEVFIEPLIFKNKLYIFGGGHVGKAIARHCCNLEFDITIIDDREAIINEINERSMKKIHSDFLLAARGIISDNDTYIAIVTYDHNKDLEVLSHFINKPYAYIGMMGSKNKVRVMTNKLKESGIEKEKIESVNMPIGIDIGANTADEIAISIVAELIKVRNEKRKKL
jgi:xanthine dehydrogenase accessory factor